MRNKPYRREMRRKHIKRKKRIAEYIYSGESYYSEDGRYDKNKIHCSCPMCSQKINNKVRNRLKHGNYYPSKNWKHSDKLKIDKMDAQLAE